jgi:hypothetical protein
MILKYSVFIHKILTGLCDYIFCTSYFIHNLKYIKSVVLYSDYCCVQLMYTLAFSVVLYAAHVCGK